MSIEFFSNAPRLPVRAMQIWQILVSKSHNRQTMTYSNLAELLGYNGSGTLGRQLGHIMFFCEQNSLPPLTVLVVNSESGLPGSGFQHESEIPALRECVYNYNWFNLIPPSEADYTKAWNDAPNNTWRNL
jgi:putative restriction endonuclease